MGTFRRWFSRIFNGSITEEESDRVNESEQITRFLFSKKNDYHAGNKRVKYRAFLPAKDGHTSVYRTNNLDEHRIWQIGADYVEAKRTDGKEIAAKGSLLAKVIYEENLAIEIDKRPHPLHANLADWPEERDARNEIALALADAAVLTLKD